MPTIASWISKNANRCGGEACVRETRIPVWCIANYRRLGMSEDEILVTYPQLSSAYLDATLKYIADHIEEIDRAIRENEAGEEGHCPFDTTGWQI